jgi:cell wall-associated NlpC family hydrolase
VNVVDEAFAEASLAGLARGQIGSRYVLGAQAPGRAFDCSGLVRFVMAALRIDLPRTANEQARAGMAVPKDFAVMRVGDLITFREGKRVSHIGIYVGDGNFVHASTTARKVIESSLSAPGSWYARHWDGVRRVLASNTSAGRSALP